MKSTFRIAATLSVFLFLAYNALAATVTMSRTPNVVRTQAQGAGTYDAYDFFYSSAPAADFTNYRLIGQIASGSFADPARLQDDRQTLNGPDPLDNTAGAVDTYASTVWASVAKTDRGYNSSIIATTGSYVPLGSGAAPTVPPIVQIDWSVSDTLDEDDNDLNDASTNGPVVATAPYHVARVLTLPGSTGTFQLLAFDTSQPDTPFVFNFLIVPEPSSFVLFAQAIVAACGCLRRRR
jgi:hypothetical protein